MGVKSDSWIIRMSEKFDMIKPFSARQVKCGKVSYGVSSYGYDMRIADEFKILKQASGKILDPKGLDQLIFENFKGRFCIIPQNSFILGRSVEYFKIPRDVVTVCYGKSTYARLGVAVNVTPFEPEWEGYATISILNCGPMPVKIYSGEGIAQVIFLEASKVCRTSYADKLGKYQAQKKITLSKVE